MKSLNLILSLIFVAALSQAQCPQSLNVNHSHCTAFNDTVDARVLKTRLCGDSITIVFDATGTTLAGDTNVYIHSGPEFSPFQGWQTAYTVGNWGVNDGIGRMTSLGGNMWSIRINPRTYYNYPVDSCLNGIFMVFRNFNGSVVANDNGNDIYLYTAPTTPTSTYTHITGTRSSSSNISYLWSDGNTDSVRVFTVGGHYTVTATGVGSCSASGTVNIYAAHAPVNLGTDVFRCTAGATTLNAGSGFSSYQWLNGNTGSSSTYNAVNPGCYWVKATDSAGCVSRDTIQVKNSQVSALSLPDSLFSCPGHPISVDAAVNINLVGDSVVIIYDATQGQTGLVGDTNVYFHSGPEFHPFQGWQLPYTVGSFTQNDGVGRMTSLGNNKWRIAIDPYCYYHINPDTSLNGIWMVFRNFDGSKTGKDPNGNDIFLLLGTPPTAAFTGVTATRKARGPLTYTWSNGVNTSTNSFTTAGNYRITVSDGNGCSMTDSVAISFNGNFTLNIGNDTTVCPGQHATFRGPAGFSSYSWNTGSTVDTLVVSTTGLYTLITHDTSGCQYTGTRRFTVSTSQVNLGADVVKCTPSPTTLNAGTGFASYKWLDGTAGTNSSYTAHNDGCYWIKAIDSAGCVSYDTVSIRTSNVNGLSLDDTAHACPGSQVNLDASTSVELHGDSLIIIYDATQGQTGLVGASKVYFHSGPAFHVGQSWQTGYTVGNFGQDDGIGRMDSLGNNKWRIAIAPHCYYHVNPDTTIASIYMVFRNANGTQTGKDNGGNDIYLDLSNLYPFSTFNGISATHKSSGTMSYHWSTGANVPAITTTTAGNYIVTVTDNNSCSKTDTIVVALTSTLTVNIGHDTTICPGATLQLNAGAGYSSYHWSNGDSTQNTTVHGAGTYSVTVSTGNCSASDTLTVSTSGSQVSILEGNLVRCTTDPDTLHASAGFNSYKWFGTGTSSQTHVAVNPGPYWLEATDANGCVSRDTICLHNSPVLGLNAPDSASVCQGDTAHADAAVSINAVGDSLVIIYDATQGQTTLAGDTNVYFHSGPEFHPFQGWQLPYTVGSFTQNDGVGRMTSLGNNKWRIAIDPYCYYHINPDTSLNGIFMVFRNFDGSKTGKDAGGNDIFVNLSVNPPTCSFNGVTPSRAATGGLAYLWSNGGTSSIGNFTTTGTYSVTVIDGSSCSKTDSVVVVAGTRPTVNLGPDTTVCTGNTVILHANSGNAGYAWNTGASTDSLIVNNAGTYSVTVTSASGCTNVDTITVSSSTITPVSLGPDTTVCNGVAITLDASGSGYTAYSWNTGATTNTLSVSTAGTYSVTVNNAAGCSSTDSVVVDSCHQVICPPPVALFGVGSVSPFNQVTFFDSTTNASGATYTWDFGDSTTGNDAGNTTHTYSAHGLYHVTLTVTDSCGTDTYSLNVDVNTNGIENIASLSHVNVYPNPANNQLNIELNAQSETKLQIKLRNLLGEEMMYKTQDVTKGQSTISLNVSDLAQGVYLIELSDGVGTAYNKFIIAR